MITMMKLPIIDNDRFLKESLWATWEVFVMMTRDVFPQKNMINDHYVHLKSAMIIISSLMTSTWYSERQPET